VFGLPRYVLPLVTAGAHEVGLMHSAPGLRPLLPDVHVLFGNAHLDLVHVQHDPGLSRLFDDAVPRASPQSFLFGACTAAPSPTDVGHDLLQFLGAAFPHQHEDCRLRDDQVLRSLERDLHSSLAEEQRVVPHPRLHRQVFDVGAADLPRLIVHARRLGHGRARPGRHDPATLDLPGLDRGGRKVETDVGALLAFFGSDEHAVTDDDQALGFRTVLYGNSFWEILGKVLLLFFPTMVLIAGVWGTMVSLYTIPFRSGRGRFLAALLMSWWDAARMAWFYWFGLARFLLVF